ETIEFSKNQTIGFELDSPRFLLRELHDEIEFNNLMNNKMVAFFTSELKSWEKRVELFPDETYAKWSVLTTSLKAESRKYLKSCCDSLSKDFDSGKMFDFYLSRLASLLLDDSITLDKSHKDIKEVTNFLIIELYSIGMDLDDSIKKIPSEIFAGVTIHGEMTISDFPCSPNLGDYKDDSKDSGFDFEKFRADVVKYYEELSLKERIMAIKSYYNRERISMEYIFPIHGFIIDEADEFELGNVNFYNPQKVEFVKESWRTDPEKKEEFFYRDKNTTMTNAKVSFQVIDTSYTKGYEVEDLLDRAISLINYIYRPEQTIRKLGNGIIILDSADSRIVSVGGGKFEFVDTSPRAESDSLKISQIAPRNIESLKKWGKTLIRPYEEMRDSEKRVIQSIYWIRKSILSDSKEDKFLNLWIALEQLFVSDNKKDKSGTFEDIYKYLPYLCLRYHFFNYGWEIFRYFEWMANSGSMSGNYLKISEALGEKSQIKRKKDRTEKFVTHYLETFINSLPELIKEAPDPIFSEKAKNLFSFYTDKKEARKVFENMLSHYQSQIMLMYRYRNKIVHNAYYNDAFLEHQTIKLDSFVVVAVETLLAHVEKGTL
ncbi:MAG: HEPN domain-containing protein, partial [Halobacteriovoraceae bacterium]|nr:HEPN domain-containing protein [Halobacteriovoraceae bacterium]